MPSGTELLLGRVAWAGRGDTSATESGRAVCRGEPIHGGQYMFHAARAMARFT